MDFYGWIFRENVVLTVPGSAMLTLTPSIVGSAYRQARDSSINQISPKSVGRELWPRTVLQESYNGDEINITAIASGTKYQNNRSEWIVSSAIIIHFTRFIDTQLFIKHLTANSTLYNARLAKKSNLSIWKFHKFLIIYRHFERNFSYNFFSLCWIFWHYFIKI